MNLLELKCFADKAIENAREFGENPADITVSIQIDDTQSEVLWSNDIELIYDNDAQASGCVLHGWAAKNNKPVEPTTEAPPPCYICGGVEHHSSICSRSK